MHKVHLAQGYIAQKIARLQIRMLNVVKKTEKKNNTINDAGVASKIIKSFIAYQINMILVIPNEKLKQILRDCQFTSLFSMFIVLVKLNRGIVIYG